MHIICRMAHLDDTRSNGAEKDNTITSQEAAFKNETAEVEPRVTGGTLEVSDECTPSY